MHTKASRSASDINWVASVKLACIVSLFAATAAMCLAGYVAESTIILCVIVGATIASWYQLEHHGVARAGHRAHVRHHH
ncbi:MAG: hypothetical protein RLZZ623_1743 [Actinomycetota bacterium]|jgi:hypothetical protein